MDLLLEEIGKLLEEQPVDKVVVTGKWTMLEAEYENLKQLDQQAREFLVNADASEDVEDKEIRETMNHQSKVEIMRAKLDALFGTPVELSQQSSSASVILETSSAALSMKLPKYDPGRFDGNLLNWLGFWADFQHVDENKNMDGSLKLNYLRSSLVVGSEPYEMIKAYPSTNDNYGLAVDALKKRYGNTDVLLQVYIRELLKLVISNVSNREKLPVGTLYNQVDSHLRALKSLNLDKADPATWLYPLVESCLPQ